jgi:hypothetical protein
MHFNIYLITKIQIKFNFNSPGIGKVEHTMKDKLK